MPQATFTNPYRPGAGHMPPHLAGREREYQEFDRLLDQDVILENLVLTGLRGVGKTVLLETFKPRATEKRWLWVGTDMSESVSVSEESLALRLIADLSVATSTATIERAVETTVGFGKSPASERVPISYEVLVSVYGGTPGLVADKIKAVLEFAWQHLNERVVFAYDEAQNLSDNASKDQYPLSILLDVFQSIQRKGIPFMLALTGLPTLFPKLVDARTFAERMFRVVTLGRLSRDESRDAIVKPIEVAACPVAFGEQWISIICDESAGYPYFIQFMCREVFDIIIFRINQGQDRATVVAVEPILRKLDSDFFAGRWGRLPDRQRELLWVIATLHSDEEEFTIAEISAAAEKRLSKGFSSSHINQMLARLAEEGIVYKNRLGRYSFAVPLLGQFILRNYDPSSFVQP